MNTFQVLVGVDKKPFDAVYANNQTYVFYTACEHLGATVENKSHDGTLLINGHAVKCEVVASQDYVPWGSLCPGTKVTVQRIQQNGQTVDWFTIPTVVAKPSAPQMFGEYEVVASVDGVIQNYAFSFQLGILDNAGKLLGTETFVMDSGDFEFMIDPTLAKKYNMPEQGRIQSNGVGGTVTDYNSIVSFDFGGVKFLHVPAIIGNSDGVPNLFGLRWFIDNGYSLLLDTVKAKLYIVKGPQYEITGYFVGADGKPTTTYPAGTNGVFYAAATVGGKPIAVGTAINVGLKFSSGQDWPAVGDQTIDDTGSVSIPVVLQGGPTGSVTATAQIGTAKVMATATWK